MNKELKKAIAYVKENLEDYELGEGWWEEYGDINDILFEL